MLNLKLHYFGHLMQGTDSLEKTLMLRKIEGKRRGWQRMSWLDGITDSMDNEFEWALEIHDEQEAWSAAVHGVAKSWTWLSNWIELMFIYNWFTLIYTWIWHNVINQLYANKINKK